MARSLVLNEDSDCLELIKRVLQENGHEVVTFAEREKALAWARAHALDLAIISLEPGRLPRGICQELKTLRKSVKILVLTRYTTKDLATEALAQGADDYLLKPIEIEKLEDKLRSILTDLSAHDRSLVNRTLRGGLREDFHAKRLGRLSSSKED